MDGTLPMLPKRKGLHAKRNQNHGKKKQKFGEINGIDEGNEYKDRFSELPEDINHRILALLRCPKDVARTRVLSKKWRSIWTSFHTFNFDQRSFPLKRGRRCRSLARENMNKFIRHINESMTTRLEPLHCIHKFRLHMTSFMNNLVPTLNFWINSAISKHVKELEIHVRVKGGYKLPPMVLTSKTITSLRLNGCILDGLAAVELPNLRELSIKTVRVDKVTIQKFVHSCPLIEDLRIVRCGGLERIHISSHVNLNRIEVHDCFGLRSVEIEAPNLQTFWFHKNICRPCKIELAGGENLKTITLKDSKMTDDFFQSMMSKFPALEKLVLLDCDTLGRITILSWKLKRLSLVRCKKLEEVNIDAPNLLSFEYRGNKMCFSNIKISGLKEMKIHFESSNGVKQFPHEMQKFLENFEPSKGFKLVVCNKEKNVTIYEELREIKLPPCSDYKMELTKSSSILRDIIIGRLQEGHPRNLCLVSCSSSKCLQFLKDVILTREESPNCCQYYTRKCWRHYLKDVKIVESVDQTTFTFTWSGRGFAENARPIYLRMPREESGEFVHDAEDEHGR